MAGEMNMTKRQSDRLRLFLAISIPETIRAALLGLQQELRPLLPAHAVRWTQPDQFHLTLKFLGHVPASDTAALSEAVRAVCDTAPPMGLRAEGTGFFPNDRAPRVFWADIKNDDGRLFQLQEQLAAAVAKFAEKQDPKPFTAHVTLARMERLSRSDSETMVSCARPNRDFGSWTAGQIELVQSTLSPSGATYAIFAAFATKKV